MKRFITKGFYITIPILLVLVGVNYFGDDAKLFNSKYEKKMAEIIFSGNYVTNISNYDERMFQKELITHMDKSPDILVIGSSRTMLISSLYFPKSTFFNNSVSGASIEDLIGIYQIYKDRNLIPKRIIIGIDPWTFNENNGQSRWKSIEYYYKKFYNKSKTEKNTTLSAEKYLQLFSLSYFQSSVKNIPKVLTGNSNPHPTLKKYNNTNTKLLDGSLVYGNDYRNASKKEIDFKIKSYIRNGIYSIEGFDTISNRVLSEFYDLISDLEKNKVTIEIFLCPYAPLAYETIRSKYPMVLETEKMIKDFSKKKNINVYGSFNPFELKLDESYFYDGMHCKEKGIEKILKMNK